MLSYLTINYIIIFIFPFTISITALDGGLTCSGESRKLAKIDLKCGGRFFEEYNRELPELEIPLSSPVNQMYFNHHNRNIIVINVVH